MGSVAGCADPKRPTRESDATQLPNHILCSIYIGKMLRQNINNKHIYNSTCSRALYAGCSNIQQYRQRSPVGLRQSKCITSKRVHLIFEIVSCADVLSTARKFLQNTTAQYLLNCYFLSTSEAKSRHAGLHHFCL